MPRNQETQMNYLVFGFLAGLFLWLALFLVGIFGGIFKVELPLLWKILAYPLAFVMKIFWLILGTFSLPENALILALMFLGSALVWGLLGLIIGWIFKITRNLLLKKE